jgi:N-acetylglucosaminyl-diphospho-decaprenol L-rhamnosyltransferase
MENITAKYTTEISISVVSHGQIDLIKNLLHDIAEHCRAVPIELILTLNLKETLPFATDSFLFPIKIVRNTTPLGFAANHNQAFAHASGRFFCVMNPDIRFDNDPFPALFSCLQDASVGVVAPLVFGESGELEDSARRFPTPLKILCKALGGCKGGDYVVKGETIYPDWVGGMFMLFPREIFQKLGGFDQRYFLYYEDVDLCARLRLLGYEVAMCPGAKVVHHARRHSHQNLKYLAWHLASMTRYFFSQPSLKICRIRLMNKRP